jgi:hypothetical protein
MRLLLSFPYMLPIGAFAQKVTPTPRFMDPHYYTGNEFAMNFEERSSTSAHLLSGVPASQARNGLEFDLE